MRHALALLGFAALTGSLHAGCATKTPPPGAAGPVEAVQAFAAAVSRADTQAAFALLSSRTQREADQIASAARAASGDKGPASGRAMLFAAALPEGRITAREASRKEAEAEVLVSGEAGAPQRFHVVREDGVWRIDLELASPAGGAQKP